MAVKVAVFSDVHGFSVALDQVLADIDRYEVDAIIAAGDLVEGGPDPLGALDRLRARDIILIQGNTDRDLAANARESKHARFAEQQLGVDNLALLGALPFSHRISPPHGRGPEDDLFVVHANPRNMDKAVPQDISDDELDELIGDTKAAVIAFGHIHTAYIRQHRDITLVDVSAVGNPKDGDLRSKWGLLTWDYSSRSWSAELHYVDYLLEETIEQFRASGYPKVGAAIRKLTMAEYGA